MSVKISTKVWEWSLSEGTHRLVMLALADHCDDDGVCCPGIARIAKKCRLSERSVQRVIGDLIELGEIQRMIGSGLRVKGPRGDGFTNAYRLVIKGVSSSSPLSEGGDIQGIKGVTNSALGGDTAMSPKPSVESSVNRQGEQAPTLPMKVAKGRKPFVAPSLTEVKGYLVELGLNGSSEREAQAFLDHHEARGWKLGRGLVMADWKAAARTWKSNASRWSPDTARAPEPKKAIDPKDYEAFLNSEAGSVYRAKFPTWAHSESSAVQFVRDDFRAWRKKGATK